ncbi:hypothetical protein SDC9_89700 [bioreactor metagenome]|uniref:Uncharacterized protein n=1 Tax=bioreactor metagenome TaxID=1076179 RepID=A0A644ZRL9_9ZZZZ
MLGCVYGVVNCWRISKQSCACSGSAGCCYNHVGSAQCSGRCRGHYRGWACERDARCGDAADGDGSGTGKIGPGDGNACPSRRRAAVRGDGGNCRRGGGAGCRTGIVHLYHEPDNFNRRSGAGLVVIPGDNPEAIRRVCQNAGHIRLSRGSNGRIKRGCVDSIYICVWGKSRVACMCRVVVSGALYRFSIVRITVNKISGTDNRHRTIGKQSFDTFGHCSTDGGRC